MDQNTRSKELVLMFEKIVPWYVFWYKKWENIVYDGIRAYLLSTR